MRKKITLYTLFFALLFAIFLLINAPANWVYKQFIETKIQDYPIQVQTPKGTIWHGHSALSTESDLPISAYVPRIQWSFIYQQLLSLKFVYKINVSQVNALGKKLGSYIIFFGIDFNGIILQIRDDNAVFDIKAVGDFSAQPSILKGQVSLRKKDDIELQGLFTRIPQIRQDGTFSVPINF